MKFAVYGKQLAEPVLPLLQTLVDKLGSAGGPLYFYEPFFRSLGGKINFSVEPVLFTVQADIQGKVDILFSIGGDGTMVYAPGRSRDNASRRSCSIYGRRKNRYSPDPSTGR